MQTVEKKEEKKPKAERDKAVTVSSISQKKKYQIDYFYCNAMRLSVIYAYSIASLVATKNCHHFKVTFQNHPRHVFQGLVKLYLYI